MKEQELRRRVTQNLLDAGCGEGCSSAESTAKGWRCWPDTGAFCSNAAMRNSGESTVWIT